MLNFEVQQTQANEEPAVAWHSSSEARLAQYGVNVLSYVWIGSAVVTAWRFREHGSPVARDPEWKSPLARSYSL